METGKEKNKTSLLANNMCLCGENSKIPTKYLLEPVREFSKTVGYKVHTQKLIIFLYTKTEQLRPKIKNMVQFIVASKIMRCLHINLAKFL